MFAHDFNRKIIKVSVTTDAQESEIERIYIRLKHSSEDIQIDEDFPSENFIKDASAYALEFAIPFEYPSGKYEVDYIWIKDKALNESNYDNSAIKSNNWDAGVEFGNRYAFEGKTIDGYIIELLEYLNHPTEIVKTPFYNIGNCHLAFTVHNADEMYEKLLDKGIEVISKPLLSSEKTAIVFFCCDPNGMRIELVEIV